MGIVEKMQELTNIAHPPSMAPSAPSEHERAENYRQLGHLRSSHGLARAGLEDSLRGYALLAGVQVANLPDASLSQLRKALIDRPGFPERVDFKHLIQLADGLRIYARDVDFSREKGGLEATVRTMTASMACFDRAIQGMQGQSTKQRAWALAHCAGARTMGYWLKKTLGGATAGRVFGAENADLALDEKGQPVPGVFELALKDFDEALALHEKSGKPYVWCKQFKAFLLTIRGGEGDFDTARELIESTRVPGVPFDSSLERSIAILNFNLIKQRPSEQKERAQASLDHALRAMKDDSENFTAAFYAAAALNVLADGKAKEDRVLDSAIQNARLRAQNIISQAYAVLVGLSVLDSSRGVQAPRESREYMELAKAHTPDLETRIVFDRALRQLMELPNVSGALQKELKEFLNAYKADVQRADRPVIQPAAKKDEK